MTEYGLESIRIDIVMPAYNEGEIIRQTLMGIDEIVKNLVHISVIVDNESDRTFLSLKGLQLSRATYSIEVQNLGPGAANAIKYGLRKSNASYVFIMMSDGSDDPRSIDSMVGLLNSGFHVACASRYMFGGSQIDGPWIKGKLSRFAGLSFSFLTGVGTADATNCFKGFKKEFLDSVHIQSDSGFEIGLELMAYAVKNRLLVGETPTTWRDRTEGQSNFLLVRWMPKYLRWYGLGVWWKFKNRRLPG